MASPNYHCSQSALYQVGRNVYTSLQNNLVSFSSFKPKYTATYVTDVNNEITAAELLPDFQARSAQSEVNYINLCTNLTTCADIWQSLKRYIIAAYAPAEQKPRLEEAGALHYERALAKNWDEAKALLTSALNFTTLHDGELQAGMNMPATFLGFLQSEVDTFNTSLTLFQQSEEEIKVGTENKILANNAIYNKIIEICLDGQVIFKVNTALKDQFIFASVLGIVSGTGTTGFRGHITNIATTLPASNVTVITMPPTKTVVSDADGYFEIIQIAAGNYQVAFSAPGFKPYAIPIYQVDSGITHNLNINLEPL